ncbi:hypothetical protein QAD02_008850 [Eretmocerus hayati]|uniref:Uncharacterized protein n=1 Tax=Eretmocerus hayati TaxID=131215 RepID=A0ACC2N8X5_9HYME|nr:hypothetical protein QAD02_008850 [Eretmocerus hayati]
MNLELISIFIVIVVHHSDAKPFFGITNKLKGLTSNLGLTGNLGFSIDHKGGLLGDFSRNYGFHFGTGLNQEHQDSSNLNNQAAITGSVGNGEESSGIQASTHGKSNFGVSGSLKGGIDTSINSNEYASNDGEDPEDSGQSEVSGKTLILGHILKHPPVSIKKDINLSLHHEGSDFDSNSAHKPLQGGFSGQIHISGSHSHTPILGSLINKADNIRKDVKNTIHDVNHSILNGVSQTINHAISSNSQGNSGISPSGSHNLGIAVNEQSSITGSLPSGSESNNGFDLSVGHANGGSSHLSPQNSGIEIGNNSHGSGETSLGIETNPEGSSSNIEPPYSAGVEAELNNEYQNQPNKNSESENEGYPSTSQNSGIPIENHEPLQEIDNSRLGDQSRDQETNDDQRNQPPTQGSDENRYHEGSDETVGGKNGPRNGNSAHTAELETEGGVPSGIESTFGSGNHLSHNVNFTTGESDINPQSNQHSGGLSIGFSGSHQLGGILNGVKNIAENSMEKIKDNLSGSLRVDGSDNIGNLAGSLSLEGSLGGIRAKAEEGNSLGNGVTIQNSFSAEKDHQPSASGQGMEFDLSFNGERNSLSKLTQEGGSSAEVSGNYNIDDAETELHDKLSKWRKPARLSDSGRDDIDTDDEEIYDDVAAFSNNEGLFESPESEENEEEEDKPISENEEQEENSQDLPNENYHEASSEQQSGASTPIGQQSGLQQVLTHLFGASHGSSSSSSEFEGSSQHGSFWKDVVKAFKNLGHKLKDIFPSLKYSISGKASLSNDISGGSHSFQKHALLQDNADGGFKIGFDKSFNLNAGGNEDGAYDQNGRIRSRLLLNNDHGLKVHGLWDTFKTMVSKAEDKVHNLASGISADFHNRNFEIPRVTFNVGGSGRLAKHISTTEDLDTDLRV